MLVAEEANRVTELADVVTPPSHIAIIMDGNGRWAKKRLLPKVAGHRKGAEVVRKCVRECSRLGVKYLTLYAFSSENWKRPEDEVKDLMGLLKHYLNNEIEELNQQNVRLRFMGARERLSPSIVELIENAEQKTGGNAGLQLILALNYGSQSEIVKAARELAREVRDGRISADEIDEQMFASHLYLPDIPDPDVIIRTSGEQRLSNFLLWQAAYAEFIFVETLWPDFDEESLSRAICEFHKRERRYGARP
ncbi:isoprenyl transferase [Emcibacter nanhaiensis]|uniref:Isoprenyl transferase n=1 Tax=Emcibacter nanhaiensis TaxID=1505037 RepID=A0A501PQV1_9PROT|nr:isoprenyl transferase [Emcibacter nanhaiensis]TPD62909.1 isoprenyl transferase [Emcibacter nanhaiensis]